MEAGNLRMLWVFVLVLAVNCGGGGTVEPPAGPSVVVKPGTSRVSVRVADQEQNEGPSITDPADTANFCKLRGDFVGVTYMEFEADLTNGSLMGTAQRVRLQNTTLAIEIVNNGNQTLTWTVLDRTTDPEVELCGSLDAVPEGEFDDTKIPSELFNMVDVMEISSGEEAADEVRIKVKVPVS